MKKNELKELMKYVGDLDSVVGTKSYTFNDGKAQGVKAIDIKNGKGLEMTVLSDKCMDISRLEYKGVNLGVMGKNGVVSPNYFTEDGARGYLKSFNIGFLSTCGLTHAGAACEVDGIKYGLHGVIGNTPAEQVSRWMEFDGDDAVLYLKGIVRESTTFSENLHMEREIKIETEANVFYITDVVKNYGYEKQPLMNIYHFNLGYPILDEGAKIYLSPSKMQPRDAVAQKGTDVFNLMEKAQEGYDEQCFFFTDDSVNKESFAMLVHKNGKLAIIIHYDQSQCPLLCEWKCMRAGDYALGLEPTTSGVMGYKSVLDDGSLRYVEPFDEYRYDFKIEITEDPSVIENYRQKSGVTKVSTD